MDVGCIMGHRWQEVSRDFTPGIQARHLKAESVSEIQQLASGTTHVYLKCQRCGEIKQRDLVGNYRGHQ